ncbi:MAG: hypothetical protein ACYS5V_15295 [Planctomycetota bacterium]|jgi:hypothetical protein
MIRSTMHVPFLIPWSGSTPGAGRPIGKVMGPTALAVACVLTAALATHRLTSPDLGYHLAYGQTFLATGRVVDHNAFIYPLPPADPTASLPAPGPGSWYDDRGRYRFPNANWLSQVVMAAVHRAAGAVGLSLLQAALAVATAALAAVALRRMGARWWALAPAVLVIALVGYERFGLRPENFGYLLLAVQLCVLAPAVRPGGRVTWRSAIILAGIQLLWVNSHVYFPVGVGVTAAVLIGLALRLLWQRAVRHDTGNATKALAASLPWLLAAVAAQAAVCLVNPWTWRLAVLPFQVLAALRSPAGQDLAPIGELAGPLHAMFARYWNTWAYGAVAVLSIPAAVVLGLRKRWACLLVLLAGNAAAWPLRRNLLLGALLIAPPLLLAADELLRWLDPRFGRKRWLPAVRVVLAVLIVMLPFWMFSQVVTGKFWYGQRQPNSFGLGLCRLEMPLDAAEWINRHCPDPADGRLFTDFGPSSNLHYFTRPHRQVPVLTNTFAYPPAVGVRIARYGRGDRMPGFAVFARRHDVRIVALRVAAGLTAGLARGLDKDPRWAMTHLSGRHVVFVRADGPYADLARSAKPIDTEAYVSRMRRLHARPAYGLGVAGTVLLTVPMPRPWRPSAPPT